MIKDGERVECIDKKSAHFGEKGSFTEWTANGLKVEFDNGKTGLYLPCHLKRLNK